MKIVFIGHSHISCIELAAKQRDAGSDVSFNFVQLRDSAFMQPGFTGPGSKFENCVPKIVESCAAGISQGAALTVLYPTGNEHNVAALVKRPDDSPDRLITRMDRLLANYRNWLIALSGYVRSPAVVIPPPPPIEDAHILNNPANFAERLAVNGLTPAQARLQAWLMQKQKIERWSHDCGIPFVELPDEVYSANGFLHERFVGKDPTHGNEAYGEMLLSYVTRLAADSRIAARNSRTAVSGAGAALQRREAARNQSPIHRQHPYVGLPDRSFWKQAVSQVPSRQFDPVGGVPFRIMRSDKVATAGSCFAQHISKRIRSGGFQFLVTEQSGADAAENCEARGFYDFSARYGNIYTARQLLQLFDRAFGCFSPLDSYWMTPDNKFCDPFRPRIEPEGFASVAAVESDRRRHLSAVKEMFEQLDVFVFTLGLTECWLSRLDGAAYPLAPGVAGGEYDASRYEFKNFAVDDVVKDLQAFIHKLRLVNPRAKLILTVSPVPLAATYDDNHVLVATTYSKSVLRVAADMISRAFDGIYYFPSYEMISGNYNRGGYFGPDLRSITTEGVDHVMAVFMRHLTVGGGLALAPDNSPAVVPEIDADTAEMTALAEAACDEELLERK